MKVDVFLDNMYIFVYMQFLLCVGQNATTKVTIWAWGSFHAAREQMSHIREELEDDLSVDLGGHFSIYWQNVTKLLGG